MLLFPATCGPVSVAKLQPYLPQQSSIVALTLHAKGLHLNIRKRPIQWYRGTNMPCHTNMELPHLGD